MTLSFANDAASRALAVTYDLRAVPDAARPVFLATRKAHAARAASYGRTFVWP
jgi:hypothetical protein